LFQNPYFFRWYKTHKIKPLFPFGHGLSYTEYSYSNLQHEIRYENIPTRNKQSSLDFTENNSSNNNNSSSSSSSSSSSRSNNNSNSRDIKSNIYVNEIIRIQVDIENIGLYDGAEVPQLYLTFPESADEPPQQLKGFQRVFLSVKEKKQVEFVLYERDVVVWNMYTHEWQVVLGEYHVHIGASSELFHFSVTFNL
jgi:beta-glucosidase